MGIETRCEATQFIFAKFIKEKNQNKTWADLMLRHLDLCRKAKQVVSIFKENLDNMRRIPICRPIEIF